MRVFSHAEAEEMLTNQLRVVHLVIIFSISYASVYSNVWTSFVLVSVVFFI